ncbi:hypothetical protein [Roseibium sp. TrichSKD4]|uniref:hypothetical protein n=1 Tax=Roseibium sp. TrichSKD4 TaxID=744980 RepID=UPI00058C2AD0|nr:hypothetical protein [Roseibium sp. TrichSKD4]
MSVDTPVLGDGPLAADRLESANINPSTGLATDYLNHFNEVMMLLEMLPDMPDCAEDVLEWKPLSYEQHFMQSVFAEKQLAVMAYNAAPDELRSKLEDVASQINRCVILAQETIETSLNPADVAAMVAENSISQIRPLISEAAGIIHGKITPDPVAKEGEAAQAEIDAMFA